MLNWEDRNKAILRQPRFIETIKILRKSISDRSDVLEIGASDASFIEYLESKSWISADKFGDPEIKVDLDGPLAKLPLDDNSIDVAICTEVIEHLSMGTYLLRELARVVKPDGRVIVSVPNIVSLKSRIKVIFGQLPISSASGDCPPELRGQSVKYGDAWVGGHVMDFNKWRLKKYVERAGLRVVKHWPMPVGIRIVGLFIVIPSWLVPKNFSDIILFELEPYKINTT